MDDIRTELLQKPEQTYIDADGLTKGGLAQLLRCPAEYRHPVRPDSDAKSFGRALHCATLQPADFVRLWHGMSVSASTAGGKSEKAAAVAAGKSVLTCAEWTRLQSMRESLWTAYADPGGLLDLGAGSAEVSIYWPCVSPSGIVRQAKGRIDLLLPAGPDGRPTLVDVKSTSGGLSPDAVAHHIAQYAYHQQAAWYLDGFKAVAKPKLEPRFIFIFVQSQPHFACITADIASDSLELARKECTNALDILDVCEECDILPSYVYTEVLQINLQSWYKQRTEERMYCKYLCI